MIVDALDRAWRAWAELGAGLSDAQWQRPTRLPGWTVRHVYAHGCLFPAGTLAGISEPEAAEPLTHSDAADLLAMMQQPGGIADNLSDTVRQDAVDRGGATSTESLVEQFTDVAPRAIAALRAIDLGRRVNYVGLAVVPVGEALRNFLMEAVVHYFDMATALDRPVPGPMAGEPVRETVRLLAGIADPVAFVDAATGRTRADIFPVLH